MADINQLDDIIEKAKEIESYVGQSQIILKTLITAKEDVGTIVRSLTQKQEELTRLQEDMSGYLKTLQTISQKADALLNPMGDQKKELEVLAKKVEDGIAGIEAQIQESVGKSTASVEAKIKDFATVLEASTSTLHKELESGIAGTTQKQEAISKTLSQRLEKGEQVAAELKAVVDQEKKSAAELRKALQDLKGMLEKSRGEIKSELKEEINAALAKQKEEITAQADKQHQELSASLKELSDKHIKVLEKDNAQLKSTINAVISKLGNVKFKKLLGL